MDRCEIDMRYCDSRLCYDGENGTWRPIGIVLRLIVDDDARGGRLRYGRHLMLRWTRREVVDWSSALC